MFLDILRSQVSAQGCQNYADLPGSRPACLCVPDRADCSWGLEAVEFSAGTEREAVVDLAEGSCRETSV